MKKTMTALEYRNILAEKLIKDFVKDFKYKTGLKITIQLSNPDIHKIFNGTEKINIDEDYPVVNLQDIEQIIMQNYPYELKDGDLKNACRKRELVDARSIFTKIARAFCFKLAAIGNYLNRDHSTIMHLEKKAEDLIKYDQNYLCIYVNIIEKLKEKYDKVI